MNKFLTVRANLHLVFAVLSAVAIVIFPVIPKTVSPEQLIPVDIMAIVHVAVYALGLYAIGLILDVIFIERSRLSVIVSSIAIGMSAGFTLMPSREFLIGSMVIVGAHILFLFSHTLRYESIGHIYRFFGTLIGVSAVAFYHWGLVSEPVVVAAIMFCHATLLRVRIENKLMPVSSSSSHVKQRSSSIADASIYEDDQTLTAQNPTRVVNGLFQSYNLASHPPTIRGGFHRDRTSKRAGQPDPNLKDNPTVGDELGVVRLPVKPRNQRRREQTQWASPSNPHDLSTVEAVTLDRHIKDPLSIHIDNLLDN